MKQCNELYYRQLRWEHKKNRDSGYYEDSLGSTCVNCGCTENIVYHHIVPIANGGTNRLSNICPVCVQCHRAIHNSKDRSEYRNEMKGGRHSTVSDEMWENVLNDYSECRIGQNEARERLKRKKGTHLVESPFYKRYLKAHGIKKIRNNIDIIIANGKGYLQNGECVGYVIYENGITQEKYYAECRVDN